MTTRKQRSFVFVVIGVLFVAQALVTASPLQNASLRALFLLHRHGARLPMPPANASAICGNHCGQLTTVGATMLFNLGRWIQTEYPLVPTTDQSMTSVIDNTYNPHYLVTRSTDVDRTIQSAGAFLRGAIDPINATEKTLPPPVNIRTGTYLPAIHTVPQNLDYEMLVWASWPSLVIRSTVTQNAFNAMMDAKIASLFAPSDYAKMGEEMGLQGLCATQPFQCALAAQDIITCAVSNGSAESFPFLLSKYEHLTQVMIEYNAVSMYNVSSSFDVQIGAKGFPLAQLMVRLMKKALAESSPTAPPMFREFSGHDITLMPFAEAIGNQSFTNPLFGGAYVVELWQPNGGSGSGEQDPVVRLRYGSPKQEFGSGFEYHFVDTPLECLHADGRPYWADPSVGCTLSSWEADLQRRAPRSSATWCYLPIEILTQIDCLPGNADDRAGRPSNNALCRQYRASCPLWACLAPQFNASQQSFSMAANGACVALTTSTSASLWGLSPWELVAGSAAAAFVVCLVVAVGVHVWLVRRLERVQCTAASVHEEQVPYHQRHDRDDDVSDDDGLGDASSDDGCCARVFHRKSKASATSAPNVSSSTAAMNHNNGINDGAVAHQTRGAQSPLLRQSGPPTTTGTTAVPIDNVRRDRNALNNGTTPPPLKAATPRRRLEYDSPSDGADTP